MLKGIPSVLPPELLKILMEMGHGDTIVIGDGNCPHAAMAKRLVRCDGKMCIRDRPRAGGEGRADRLRQLGKADPVHGAGDDPGVRHPEPLQHGVPERLQHGFDPPGQDEMCIRDRINPHFLYNTLDTIIWMSAGGKNDEVVEVPSALARLFRTSISKGENLVTLLNEVENIKSYLTIQKMRYEDKLSWRVDVPPGLLGLMTPKLILQPIVENAVYHGVKMRCV